MNLRNIFIEIRLLILKSFSSIIKKIFNNKVPKYMAKLLTKVEHNIFFIKRNKNKSHLANIDDYNSHIINQLELNGYYVLKNYWSKEACEKVIIEINKFIEKYPKYVNSNCLSDERFFGAENCSDFINNYFKDRNINEIANRFNGQKTILTFTLAAKMNFKIGNKGSGEGWHRDGFHRQFKSMLYLTDVNMDNGPFELILNSQKINSQLSDMKSANLKFNQYRLSDEEIKKILHKNKHRKKSFCAEAGSLILFDTSTLHRGAPIKRGCRYALTNYFYREEQVSKELFEKFNVFPKKKKIY
ncbi:phytanoyl-CoA dioxygenase family protein [Prochlorococcus marinus]|uniref:phytanoyl-CoA dioxygenase family protein n=1 Tax=Prochlorococcus marinus TaxID=1219 RepID=UPI001ADAC461|nr:phytanoyl-CoA dioxygenase family protein [Prochlorococcus marinus]MBO8219525.1 phytanoyl-CoA dioxygenase family protein [Prochlorococcus marinus CUG1416]MBW3051896.1 hypothetical protein [Prochlorococcus marinus str. MU1416]